MSQIDRTYKRGLAFFLTAALICPPAVLAQTQPLPPEVIAYADTILYNGKIVTANEAFAVAEAVAIRDGKFLKVGTTQEILRTAGPKTRKIDLQGKSVVPGFFDPHLHGAWVGNVAKSGEDGRVDFSDIDAGLAEVAKIVAKKKPGEWIMVNGPRSLNFYTVTRKHLDKAAPNNPLIFLTQSQEVLANSKAMELADLPDDMPGLIKDPATGEPTGQMFGFAAGVLSYDVAPLPPVTDELLDAQKAVFKRLNSQGLTTIIGRAQGLSTSVLRDLWIADELTVRARIILEFTRLNPYAEAYLKRIGNLSGLGDGMLTIAGATVQPVDGATGDGAALSAQKKIRKRPQDPYEFGSNKWISYGPINVDLPKEQTEWRSIQAANRFGWNITGVHSQGDLGSQILLQAFEDAHKERPIGDRRFGFDHGLLRTAKNFELAHKLGVIPSIGPKYLFMNTPSNLTFLYGADAVHRMTPVKSLIDRGIKPVLEADIAGEYSAPLWLMEALITRKDKEGRVWGPHEKISREQALWMKTAWAARYSGDEERLGTIEAGKLADLVVLGGDYMTVPEEKISELPIVYTIINGKIVYDLEKDGDVRTPHWDREGAFGARGVGGL